MPLGSLQLQLQPAGCTPEQTTGNNALLEGLPHGLERRLERAAAGWDAGEGGAFDTRVALGDGSRHVFASGPYEGNAGEDEQHVEGAGHLGDGEARVGDGVGVLVAALAHSAAPLPLERVQPSVLVQLHNSIGPV